jgi:hypothetical protein
MKLKHVATNVRPHANQIRIVQVDRWFGHVAKRNSIYVVGVIGLGSDIFIVEYVAYECTSAYSLRAKRLNLASYS